MQENCWHRLQQKFQQKLQRKCCSYLLQGYIGNRVPEGEGAGQQLVHQHAHTPHVCLGIIPLQDDFWCHVDWCAGPGLQLTLIRPMPACFQVCVCAEDVSMVYMEGLEDHPLVAPPQCPAPVPLPHGLGLRHSRKCFFCMQSLQ